MMSQPDFAIEPGAKLGGFSLGTPFGDVVSHIEKHFRSPAEVIYSDVDLLAMDLVIRLPLEGMQLLFDSASQRLKMIDVFDHSKVKLSYRGVNINANEGIFKSIYNVFGPTRGKYMKSGLQYLLSYPGLSLFFTIKKSAEGVFAQGYDLTRELVLPDSSSPLLSRVCIHQGNIELDSQNPNSNLTAPYVGPPPSKFPFYGEKVLVEPCVGLTFTRRNSEINFGDSVQDVIVALGAPSNVFYKSEDKMRIHAHHPLPSLVAADYFYNYYSFGLDVLFDAFSHTVKKFVLHSNHPGHFDFHRYLKCFYELSVDAPLKLAPPSHSATSSNSSSSHRAPYSPDPSSLLEVEPDSSRGFFVEAIVDRQPTIAPFDDVPRRGVEKMSSVDLGDDSHLLHDSYAITPDSKWGEVRERLSPMLSRPVALNRPPSTNTTNPFRPSYFYSFKNIIFEVMENEHIATVIIYKEQD